MDGLMRDVGHRKDRSATHNKTQLDSSAITTRVRTACQDNWVGDFLLRVCWLGVDGCRGWGLQGRSVAPRPSFRPRCSSQTIRHRSSTSLVLIQSCISNGRDRQRKVGDSQSSDPSAVLLSSPRLTPRPGVSPLTTTPFVSTQFEVYHPGFPRYASSRLLSDAQDGLLTTLPFGVADSRTPSDPCRTPSSLSSTFQP